MSNYSKSTKIGLIILAVLCIFTFILIWRPKPQPEEETPSEHAMATATPPEIQVQPGDQSMAMPSPVISPTATLIPPTPLPTPSPEPVFYQAYVVQPGDTIQSVAQTFNTSIGLLAIRLTALEFSPGNTIQVPIPNPAACPSGKLHIVEQHQTLSGISRLYGVELEALMVENELIGDVIFTGDVLCLPPGGY